MNPKSVSVAALLNAGKLVKPPQQERVTLHPEELSLKLRYWNEVATVEFMIDELRFAHGGFRDAHNAYAQGSQLPSTKWVVKRYLDGAVKSITGDLHISSKIKQKSKFNYMLWQEIWQSNSRKEYQLNLVKPLNTGKFIIPLNLLFIIICF